MAKYAKGRTHKKSHKDHYRRRRVGAMSLSPSSPLMMYLPIAAGYFLGDKINAQITKLTGTMDGKIIAAAEAGLGALLVFKGKKSLVKNIAGGLLLGAGVKKALSEFGVLNGIGGYGMVPVVGRRRLNGYGAVPVVGGYTPNQMLAGALNGSNSGYPVPRPPHKQVMGSTGDENGNGSGINSNSRN